MSKADSYPTLPHDSSSGMRVEERAKGYYTEELELASLLATRQRQAMIANYNSST